MELNKLQINQMMFFLVIFSLYTNMNALKVYQELNDISLTQSSNIMSCSILPKIDYYYLSQSQPNVNYQMKIRESHYAVDIFVDFYLIDEYINKPINILLDNILIDQYSVENDHSVPFCNILPSQISTYFKTYTHYQQELNLGFQLENTNSFTLGIRNIQIIPKQCHKSCSQCIGPEKNQCKSCNLGAQLSKMTNECKCPSITPYLSLQQNQCLKKCDSNEYFDKVLEMCIYDDKIEQMQFYFWNTYDFTGWSMMENGKASPLDSKQYMNMNGKGVGQFFVSQSINYKFNNVYNYQLLRIRADIYIFKSQQQPEIYVQVDKIKKLVSPLHYYNETELNGYLLYHIDYTIDALSISNITIIVISNQNLQWGINQIIINTINCQANCNSCLTKLICGVCKIGYYLYKGKCVTICPNYSTLEGLVCKDITEQYQLTTYLLRAFYDNLIINFMVQNTKSITTFYQNQFGTYYNGVRYFGGLKDNSNQYFFKQFNNLPPHYNIILQLNVITFEFTKLLPKGKQKPQPNIVSIFIDNYQTKNIQSMNDQIQLLNIEHKHSFNNLTLAMISVPIVNTYFSFGISNINIMIQRCYPLCRSCIGPNQNDCTEWIIEQNSQNQTCNIGYIFDMEQQKCLLCPIGCQKCSDQVTCLKCEDSFIQQGSSCYCLNGYIDEFTFDCIVNPINPL